MNDENSGNSGHASGGAVLGGGSLAGSRSPSCLCLTQLVLEDFFALSGAGSGWDSGARQTLLPSVPHSGPGWAAGSVWLSQPPLPSAVAAPGRH